MSKKRNSSIEVLRIIAMLMIIMYHYAWHGGIREFSGFEFGANVVFLQCLLTLGRIGCCIFAMISGYFMISSKQKNYYPKIISLTGTMYFYYIGILVVMLATKAVPVSGTLAVKSCLPMLFGTWYIIFYMLLLLLIPFINPFLRSLDERTYRKLVIILLVIWSIIPTASADAWEFSDIDFFLVMYILGGYFRLYPIKKKLPWGVITLISYLLLFLSVIAFDVLGIVTDHLSLLDKAYYFGKINSALGVVCTISIFMWFLNKDFYHPWINKISSSTLGVYLMHNNFLLRVWLFKVFMPNTDYIENPYLNVLFKTVVIFVGGVAIELIRAETVGKLFDRLIDKKKDKLAKL